MKRYIRDNFYKITGILFLISQFTETIGQKDIKDYQKEYPGESRICLVHKNDISIGTMGSKLQIEMREREESLCLDKNAMLQADESVTYSSFYKLRSLLAETILPRMVGHQTIRVSKFDTADYNNPSVFYDDIKSIHFNYPKLSEGAKTLLDYTYDITEPRHLGAFYFNNYIPADQAEVSVSFPKNVKIGYKLFNCDSLNIEFTQRQNSDKTVYSWKARNIPRLHAEDQSPSIAYYAAHMFVYIKEFTVDGKTTKILSNVSDLYSWYSNLTNEVNKGKCPQLKTFVDSLTTGTTCELEKVRKIYFWVQDHIKYIAFEAGREGFVPRDADVVFNRRYGDCKDMASLINKMLELAEIKSYLTWVGTRHIPYKYEDLPLPAVDNHMIVTYKQNNKNYFLDATPGAHPFNYPSYMIQGKEALFGIGNNKYEIVNIPEINSELNRQSDTLFIKLEGKKIKGTAVSYFKGYSRVDMYNYIIDKDKKAQSDFLKKYFEKGNNKFLIDKFDIKDIDQRDKDLVISYDFNLGDYAQIVGNEIFINLNMDKTDVNDLIKNSRKVPLESKYKKQINNDVVLTIPDGYQLSYMPKGSTYKNDLFGFDISYHSDHGRVYLTHQLFINYLLLTPDHFGQWNDMLEALKSAYKNSIILKKS
jgi:hypothetical protein